jgi:hypothetical protein
MIIASCTQGLSQVTPWVSHHHTVPVTCDTAPVTGVVLAGTGFTFGCEQKHRGLQTP